MVEHNLLIDWWSLNPCIGIGSHRALGKLSEGDKGTTNGPFICKLLSLPPPSAGSNLFSTQMKPCLLRESALWVSTLPLSLHNKPQYPPLCPADDSTHDSTHDSRLLSQSAFTVFMWKSGSLFVCYICITQELYLYDFSNDGWFAQFPWQLWQFSAGLTSKRK